VPGLEPALRPVKHNTVTPSVTAQRRGDPAQEAAGPQRFSPAAIDARAARIRAKCRLKTREGATNQPEPLVGPGKRRGATMKTMTEIFRTLDPELSMTCGVVALAYACLAMLVF